MEARIRYRIAAPLLWVACRSANAQSSVTLYGMMDLGITYVNSAQTGSVRGQHNGAMTIYVLRDSKRSSPTTAYGPTSAIRRDTLNVP